MDKHLEQFGLSIVRTSTYEGGVVILLKKSRWLRIKHILLGSDSSKFLLDTFGNPVTYNHERNIDLPKYRCSLVIVDHKADTRYIFEAHTSLNDLVNNTSDVRNPARKIDVRTCNAKGGGLMKRTTTLLHLINRKWG